MGWCLMFKVKGFWWKLLGLGFWLRVVCKGFRCWVLF